MPSSLARVVAPRNRFVPVLVLFVVAAMLGASPVMGQDQAQDRANDVLALVGSTLVHPDAPPVDDGVVLIEGDVIRAAGPASEVAVPEGATILDVSGRYVMPGLVDGHVHFFQSGGLYTRPDVLDLRDVRPYEEELRLIRERLPDTFRRYLASGITSVVDVGGPMWNLDVRAQADTTATAPTVVTAGPLISSVQPSELSTNDPPILKIESPEAAREEVRRQVEAGVDLIKIWYIVPGGQTPAAFRPVVEATIDEAHDAGMRVAVHATELETARAAVEAGADVLVHSVFNKAVDDAFVELLLDEDVIYTPTLMVSERYRETFTQQLDLTAAEHRLAQKEVVSSLFDSRTLPDSLLPGRLKQAMQDSRPIPSDTTAIRNLGRLHEAGVTIAAGTDAGNIGTPHGPALTREFELMRAAGLSPQEILYTATVGGARLMGRDDLGRIESGMQADLVVLRSNPLDDLQHVASVETVVRRGTTIHVDALVPPMPLEAVQQQLNAYNARDIDGFVDAFADSLTVARYPGQEERIAREQLCPNYGSLFDNSPALHAEITNRIVHGRIVIDQEVVTGMNQSEEPFRAVAIYHVNEEGKIDRMEFVR